MNDTSKVFLEKLKEKKAINEGDSSKSMMDLSELRVGFNRDLEKRHREADNTFGMGQNDSSEFMFLLFEFLVKWGKNEDLKSKETLLGL